MQMSIVLRKKVGVGDADNVFHSSCLNICSHHQQYSSQDYAHLDDNITNSTTTGGFKPCTLNDLFIPVDEVVLEIDGYDVYVKNVEYETTPLWIHGNGPSKVTYCMCSHCIQPPVQCLA